MPICVGHLLLAASMCSLLTAIGGGPVRTGNGNPEITSTGDFWLKPVENRIGFRFRKEQNCGITVRFPTRDGGDVEADGTPVLAGPNKYIFAGHTGVFNADGFTDYEVHTTGKIVHGADEWPLKPLAVTDSGLHVNVTALTSSCAVEVIKGKIVAASSNAGNGWPIWATVVCVIGGFLLVSLIVALVVWIVVRRFRRQSKLYRNEGALSLEQKKTRLSETVTPTPPMPTQLPSVPAASAAIVDLPPPTPNLPPSSAVPTTEPTPPAPTTAASTNVPVLPQKTASKHGGANAAAAGTPTTVKCERRSSVEV